MLPWRVVGHGRASEGGELILYERDGEFTIRVDGRELMSSRAHGSEEAMAELGCAGRSQQADARVLVGGLGLGFTLRAALARLSPTAEVTVAELLPEVVEWNRGILAPLAGHPLADPRVAVKTGDVAGILKSCANMFDTVLLDVDNGPQALTSRTNAWLYGEPGVRALHDSLRAGGTAVVWSAGPDVAFEHRLQRAGFHTEVHEVPALGTGGDTMHTLFVGRV